MDKRRHLCILICCVLTCVTQSIAQQQYTISGYVYDAVSGESLIGTNIFVEGNKEIGTASDEYGFYAMTLDSGQYNIVYSFLGFEQLIRTIDLREDMRISVELTEGVTIEEVIVEADKEEDLQTKDAGIIDIDIERIKRLPVVFGEVDVIKTIQLLPGVIAASEGTTNLYVRGGGPDQNLILLDEAQVYNSGHLLGFFSIFNSDAIENTTLIKGTMPAKYGGRLSSVLDIEMREGNKENFAAEGGIGLISSRLTVEGPIVKGQTSFIVSGRRTYAFDIAQPVIDNTDFKGTNYYFYDLNAKISHRFSDKDRIFFNTYFGRDILNYGSADRNIFFKMAYGNNTATLRWNHLLSDKAYFNVSAIYNDYELTFNGNQEEFEFNLLSGVRDWNLKFDLDYFPHPDHHIEVGATYINHKLTPNIVTATNGEVQFGADLVAKYANEYGLYVMDQYRVSNTLLINAGLRYSRFNQVGPYTSEITGRTYRRSEVVKTYDAFEPRLGFSLRIDDRSSLKGGVSFTNQYIHLVSNSTSTLPTDVWVPSTERVKPQRGIQYSFGFFNTFANQTIETSLEFFIKHMDNQIEYRESFIDNGSAEVENEFVFGEGNAFGAEIFISKNVGPLTGWIGYTLSNSTRSFPDIENGRTFPARFDKTHDLSVVASYKAGKRVELSGTFVYGTGNTFTPIRSIYFIEKKLNVRYSSRNSARLEPYHRLDLSLVLLPREKPGRNFESSWMFSIYNVYSRKNPFFTYTDFETDLDAGTATASAYKVALFPIIPTITWNFKWR